MIPMSPGFDGRYDRSRQGPYRVASEVGDQRSIPLGQVFDDHFGVGGVQEVAESVEPGGVDELVVLGIEYQIRAPLVRVADEIDDLAAWFWVRDVPDVELRSQGRGADEHPFEECAVRAVVPLPCVISGAVSEAGRKQEEDVHGFLRERGWQLQYVPTERANAGSCLQGDVSSNPFPRPRKIGERDTASFSSCSAGCRDRQRRLSQSVKK